MYPNPPATRYSLGKTAALSLLLIRLNSNYGKYLKYQYIESFVSKNIVKLRLAFGIIL